MSTAWPPLPADLPARLEAAWRSANHSPVAWDERAGGQTADHNFIALLILPVLCVTGLIGNVLVCIAIWTDKRLHNVTNYFLFSLALADLFVCTIVMPLAILVEVKHGMWIWSFGLCLLYTYADVFLCSASIVHISVISLDRYLGISRPFKVRNKSRTVVVLKICFVWVMTIIISSPLAALAVVDPRTILEGNTCTIKSQQYMIYGSTLSFLIPFIIMTITFTKTTQLLNKQANALAQKATEGCGNGLRRTVMQHRKLGYTRTNSGNAMITTTPARLDSARRVANGVTIQMSPLTGGFSLPDDHLPPVGVDEHDLTVQRPHFNHSTDTEESAMAGSKTSVDQRSLREFTELPVLVSQEFAHLRSQIQRRSTRLRSHLMRVRARLVTMARRNHHRVDNTSAELANEHKATRVLAVVFACFFTCWAPFFVTNFTLGFCGDQCAVPPWLGSVILWLGYLSSTLNPVIYTIFNRRFREAFLRILRCRCCQSREANYSRSQAFLTGEATWTCMDKSAILYNKESVSVAPQNGSIRLHSSGLHTSRVRLSERHRVRAVMSHSSSTSSRLMQSCEHLPTATYRTASNAAEKTPARFQLLDGLGRRAVGKPPPRRPERFERNVDRAESERIGGQFAPEHSEAECDVHECQPPDGVDSKAVGPHARPSRTRDRLHSRQLHHPGLAAEHRRRRGRRDRAAPHGARLSALAVLLLRLTGCSLLSSCQIATPRRPLSIPECLPIFSFR